MSTHVDRRKFLKMTAAAAATSLAFPRVVRGDEANKLMTRKPRDGWYVG